MNRLTYKTSSIKWYEVCLNQGSVYLLICVDGYGILTYTIAEKVKTIEYFESRVRIAIDYLVNGKRMYGRNSHYENSVNVEITKGEIKRIK